MLPMYCVGFFCCCYLFVLNILQVSSVALDRAACFFVWFICLFILNAICKDSGALFYHCFCHGEISDFCARDGSSPGQKNSTRFAC